MHCSLRGRGYYRPQTKKEDISDSISDLTDNGTNKHVKETDMSTSSRLSTSNRSFCFLCSTSADEWIKHGRTEKFGCNGYTGAWRKNEDIDGDEEQIGKTKVPSSLSLPLFLSPLAPAASWAQLSTWLGCFRWQAVRAMKQEGTRDWGHLDNTRPHNLLLAVYPNPLSLPLYASLPLHTNNLLHYFKYFIPQALCLSLPHIFPPAMVRLSSIRFSVCACHFLSLILPSFFLPSSGSLSPTVTSACFCYLAVMSHVFASATHHFSQTEIWDVERGRERKQRVRGWFGGG